MHNMLVACENFEWLQQQSPEIQFCLSQAVQSKGMGVILLSIANCCKVKCL